MCPAGFSKEGFVDDQFASLKKKAAKKKPGKKKAGKKKAKKLTKTQLARKAMLFAIGGGAKSMELGRAAAVIAQGQSFLQRGFDG